MLDKLVEDWHNSISYALRKEKCQHLISSGINQTQRSKPPTKKNRKARSKLIQNLPYLFFFFKNGSHIPKIKIGSESLMLGSRGAREHEGRFKGWGRKTPEQTILFSLLPPSLKPQIRLSHLCEAFNQFLWQRFNCTFEYWQMSCQNQPITEH